MINKINLLIAISNKLALKLSYDEGEKCKTKTKKAQCESESSNSSIFQESDKNSKDDYKSKLQHIDLTLEMANIGFKLSTLYNTRFIVEEPIHQEIRHQFAQPEIENHEENQQNQMAIVMNGNILPILNDTGKDQLKLYAMRLYEADPSTLASLLATTGLSQGEFLRFVSRHNRAQNRRKLRERVLQIYAQNYKKSSPSKITFTFFRKLAKSIFRSPYFRAGESWCNNFIQKQRLQEFVQMSDDYEDFNDYE